MKRKIWTVALLLLLMAVFSGCGHEHEWNAAACETAKTCIGCGETEGEALGHDWQEASCSAPQTCARCHKTEGQKLDHQWQEASCTAPKTCSGCGETEGDMTDHTILYGNLYVRTKGGIVNDGVCEYCGDDFAYVEYVTNEAAAYELMQGRWDLYSVHYDNSSYKYQEDEKAGDYLILDDCGYGTFCVGGTEYPVTWQFKKVTTDPPLVDCVEGAIVGTGVYIPTYLYGNVSSMVYYDLEGFVFGLALDPESVEGSR